MAILESSNFGGTAPLYGFDSNWDSDAGTYFNFTQFLSGGPGDRAYLRSVNIDSAVFNQFYSGWGSTGFTAVANGVSRFIRCYLRINSPYNGTGPGDPWSSKWIMVGDQGGAEEQRVIAQLACRTEVDNSDIHLRITKNIGSTPGEGAGDVNLTSFIGSWIAIQMEARADASNGYSKIWVNNDTYGSPSAASSNFPWSGANWTSIEVGPAGFFQNATTGGIGNVSIDMAKFEYADSFDASWYANINTGGGGGGATFNKSFGIINAEG